MLDFSKDFKLSDSISRTIKISGKTFDEIVEIADENNVSFNRVVNILIDEALKQNRKK